LLEERARGAGMRLAEWVREALLAAPVEPVAGYSLSMGEAAADEAAAGLFPGLFGPTDNQNMLNPSHTAVVGSTFNQAISNGSGTEHITIQYITPIPAIDLFGKSAQGRSDVAHDAGSRTTDVTFVAPKKE
jgi:hypothetical protein